MPFHIAHILKGVDYTTMCFTSFKIIIFQINHSVVKLLKKRDIRLGLDLRIAHILQMNFRCILYELKLEFDELHIKFHNLSNDEKWD